MADRIAVVTTSYPSAPGDPSGAFVREEVRRLSRGAVVHVLCPAPAVPSHGGVVVHAFDAGGAFGWPGASIRLRERPTRVLGAARFGHAVRRRLALMRPDRVRAHWLLPSGWLCADLGLPLEVVCHGSDLRLLARLPRAVRIAVARGMVGARLELVDAEQRSLLREALPRQLATAILRGHRVSPSPLPPLRPGVPPPGLPATYAVVVGRLLPSKRVPLAIAACDRAALDCVVVGDGPVRLPPSPRLHHLGRRSHPETLAVIAGARLLLHTSAEEGAPTVVREARALGIPVVACPAGDLAARAALDPEVELVAPDPDAIALALRRITAQVAGSARPA